MLKNPTVLILIFIISIIIITILFLISKMLSHKNKKNKSFTSADFITKVALYNPGFKKYEEKLKSDIKDLVIEEYYLENNKNVKIKYYRCLDENKTKELYSALLKREKKVFEMNNMLIDFSFETKKEYFFFKPKGGASIVGEGPIEEKNTIIKVINMLEI